MVHADGSSQAGVKYQAKQYENWEVVAWENDTRIKMKAFINGRSSYDQEAELVRQESGWTLDLGKKTDRPKWNGKEARPTVAPVQ